MAERTCNRCNKRLLRGQAKFCSHLCANTFNTKTRAAVNAQAEWPTCKVEQCAKPARSRKADLCPMHYHRMYRYGSLEALSTLIERGERKPTNERADLRGMRFGTLTALEPSGDYWICQCDCGESRTTRIGDLNRTGDNNTCGVKANHLSDDIEYTAAHGRVTRLRGPAKRHPCVDCGGPAQHWSYDHSDEGERISRTVGVAYSLKTDHYQARCVPCHKRYDLGHINATSDFGYA